MRSISAWNSATSMVGTSGSAHGQDRDVATERRVAGVGLEHAAQAIQELLGRPSTEALDLGVDLLLAELGALRVGEHRRTGVEDHQPVARLELELRELQAAFEDR